MDAVLIIAVAAIVVIGAFYFLGIGKAKPGTLKQARSGSAYSKRSHRRK